MGAGVLFVGMDCQSEPLSTRLRNLFCIASFLSEAIRWRYSLTIMSTNLLCVVLSSLLSTLKSPNFCEANSFKNSYCFVREWCRWVDRWSIVIQSVWSTAKCVAKTVGALSLTAILNSFAIRFSSISFVFHRRRYVLCQVQSLAYIPLNLPSFVQAILNFLSTFSFMFIYCIAGGIICRWWWWLYCTLLCWGWDACLWSGSQWKNCWVLAGLKEGWLSGLQWYGGGNDWKWGNWSSQERFLVAK